MKIQCILKRDGGTKVTIGNTEYHFAPDDNGDHFAEVTDKAHIERFLNIPEAYSSTEKRPKSAKKADKTDQLNNDNQNGDDGIDLQGSDWEPVNVEYGNGLTITTKELVERAFKSSGLEKEEWNESSKDYIEAQLATALETLETEIQKPPVFPVTPKTEEPKLSKAEKKAALAVKKAALGQR